ncbi:MAG: hypothetical protein LBT47_06775 [Deltaproteobacteria bacterium]|nr:hypothetical protein [Deltaproteobacteria bacterium]
MALAQNSSFPADSSIPVEQNIYGYVPRIIRDKSTIPEYLIESPGATAFMEARKKLLSASREDLEQGYAAQLDKVVILGFKIASQHPEDPAVWRLLGRLSETRSLFANNQQERLDLMTEARSHFEKALDFELKNQPTPSAQPPSPVISPSYSDPYINELFWTARIQRGEIELDDIKRHYGSENINPLHRPEFWRDLFYWIYSENHDLQQQRLNQAREDFAALWASMPVEVPWPGPLDKFGPQKFKKVQVLQSWVQTLIALSEKSTDPMLSSVLFLEAIDRYLMALNLPLDRHELSALISRLDQADASVPDDDSLLRLWECKDTFYDHWQKLASDDPEIWLSWGQQFYSRADRQKDDRIFHSYLKEGDLKFQRYVELSSSKAKALFEWGQRLEFRTDIISSSEPAEHLLRRRFCLEAAAEKYRQAQEEMLDSLPVLQSLARILLKLSVVGQEKDFEDHRKQSEHFFALALSRSPDTSSAWFLRGQDCLEVQSLNTVSQSIREALTADALAAFRQFLWSNTTRVDRLRLMADRIWVAAEEVPAYRVLALGLLNDVCARLIELVPAEPDYRFARGLTLFSLLSSTPNWPDDKTLTDSAWSKRSFGRVLLEYRMGLELLSVSSIPRPSPLDHYDDGLPHFVSGHSFTLFSNFLRDSRPTGATLLSASFQERLAAVLNCELERLLTALRVDTLPPWYKFRLASFFRRVAATGYPPIEDQMAFFRLAELLLTEATNAYQEPPEDPPGQFLAEYATILAEKGLLMCEMSLVAADDVGFLLSEAEKYWTGAEAAKPGSSRYALARWAAWNGDVELTAPLLRHTTEQQDSFLWPTFDEVFYEPAFANFISQKWFKSAWFGYRMPPTPPPLPLP